MIAEIMERKKSTPIKNEILWVYGCSRGSISRFIREMLQNDMKHDGLKINLRISFNGLVFPIPAWVENRTQAIKGLTKKTAPKGLVIIEGLLKDISDPEMTPLHKNSRAVFINPSEVQFHLDTGLSGMSYKEARMEAKEIQTRLSDHFKQIIEIK